ncbi:hypothetical protein IGI39_004614 [Enterococcus sp. AZ135]|uniref:hypothetical protein n=1 Tax=unclassified Enterococcus TaxID=2608891 RepID=UPI003F25ABB8
MNTYVKVVDKNGEDYYFAEVEYEQGIIGINRHQGLYKVKEKEIYPCDVREIAIEKTSDERIISFYHDKEQYTFFDSGNGIVSFLNWKLNPLFFSKVV